MMLEDTLFGPVKIKAPGDPDFNLHDLCVLWTQAADEDLHVMIDITKKLGGVFNDPGVVWNGLLLDGRNRQIVCKQLGLPYEYREFHGNFMQAESYVIAKNLARRHLTKEQKAMWVVLGAKVREKHGHGDGPNVKKLSEEHGLMKRVVRKAIHLANLAEGAVEDGKEIKDDPRIRKILAGESSVSKEMQEIKDAEKRLNLTGEKRKPHAQPYDPTEDCYTDDSGLPVAGTMIDIWRALPEFSRTRAFAMKLCDDVKKLMQHPAAQSLSVEHVRHLSDLVRDLEAKQPSHVCPHCKGGRKCNCPLCRTRWLGRGVDDRLDCYCCQGMGYLVKEQPFPNKEWH